MVREVVATVDTRDIGGTAVVGVKDTGGPGCDGDIKEAGRIEDVAATWDIGGTAEVGREALGVGIMARGVAVTGCDAEVGRVEAATLVVVVVLIVTVAVNSPLTLARPTVSGASSNMWACFGGDGSSVGRV